MAEPSLYRATATATIRTTPEAAFAAWLDPRQAAPFRLVMQGAAESFEHTGRYVVIDRPRRLVFTWISVATDHRLSLVTIVFTPADGGVRIDLEHEGIPDAERAGRHQGGWTSILRKLATLDR